MTSDPNEQPPIFTPFSPAPTPTEQAIKPERQKRRRVKKAATKTAVPAKPRGRPRGSKTVVNAPASKAVESILVPIAWLSDIVPLSKEDIPAFQAVLNILTGIDKTQRERIVATLIKLFG